MDTCPKAPPVGEASLIACSLSKPMLAIIGARASFIFSLGVPGTPVKEKALAPVENIVSILASNANAWVTVTDSGEVVRVTDWCGWGKTYYDKNWYLEQQIK